MAELSGRQLDVILEQISERNQVVDLRESLSLAAQVADALSHAHQQDIVHGRLAPANLLIEGSAQGEEWSLRVLVTGLDRDGFHRDRSHRDSLPLENQAEILPYLAPEQCTGAPLLQQGTDNRCDIYALGAILYRLVTGRLPYTFVSMAEAVRVHSANQQPPAPQEICPGLPATVAAIIHKAMARQPEKRFQAASQMAHALRQAAALLTEAAEKNFAPPEHQPMSVSLLSLLPVASVDSGKANGKPAEPPSLHSPPSTLHPPRAPSGILIAGQGHAPRTIKLTKPVVTIGRSQDNDIALEGLDISRHHARLEWTGDGWQVTDLGSANGTRLATSQLTPNVAQTWPVKRPLHIGPYSLHWLQGAPDDRRRARTELAEVTTDDRRHATEEPALRPVIGRRACPEAGPESSKEGSSVAEPALRLVLSPRRKGRRSPVNGRWSLATRVQPRYLFAAGLLAIWLLVLAGVPGYLPVQPASWLTFTALLITPGYLLADLITWRTRLDWLERLALALPLGVAVLAVPGTVALLQHLTLVALVVGWTIVTTLIVIIWLWHGWRVRSPARPPGDGNHTRHTPWAADEIAMLLLLLAAFIAVVPTLSLPKIDGDAYAVSAFAADALSGLPLNASEPLFGTDFGPGVRMLFNQSLPLSYLWSYLSKIDPITLTATASRSMLALWALLATYALGKAAGSGSRRFGLFTASIQMLIYLAAPFARGDNVSLFFFERINADKFMVPVTMLPIVFALAIRFVSDVVGDNVANSRRDLWLAAAVAAFAVSTIHPLVAAMLALGLGAFAGLHWLLNLRQQQALKRSLALAGLVAVAMFLPAVQLVTARGQAPLAPSYPDSFEGWPIGEKWTPILPFVHVRTLDLYGPLPLLSQLEAGAATSTTSPFLMWRFAVNMGRQRLILIDLNQYISDPTLILELPYLLTLLLLPLLLWRMRRDVAAQFAVATTLAVLFVMFNPVVTPLIGSLVMPWILWRFVWLLPYALVIALAAHRLLLWLSPALATWMRRLPFTPESVLSPRRADLTPYGVPDSGQNRPGAGVMLGFVVIASLALVLPIVRNIQHLNDRSAAPYFFPTPERMLIRLNEFTGRSGPVTVLADQDLSVTIPAYVARANVVAHRVPTTSELFPADRQDEALQRLIDQDTFYRTPYLTTASIGILRRYNVGYVITSSGSDQDMQLRLAPQWFEWLMDDQSYTLYRVRHLPAATAAIRGNDALAQQQWAAAERRYQAALAEEPGDLLALAGLVESAYAQGQFEEALTWLKQAQTQSELPILHYRLGRLYAERGQIELAVAEFRQAQQAAPHVSRFHIALGHACLAAGGPESAKDECAAEQYAAAVASEDLPDDAARLIARADLWRQQGRLDRALPLYEQAVALRPSQYNRLMLERVYREDGQFERAQSLVRALRAEHPLSAEMATASAVAIASQNQTGEAIGFYRRAIWAQTLQAQDSTGTRLALARLLLETGRLDEAGDEIEVALARQPYNATAHRLQGDLYSRQQHFDRAAAAYYRAFELDPSQAVFYALGGDQLRQYNSHPNETLALLQAAVAARPEEAALLLALGDQWQNLGDLHAARDAYQVALNRLDPYLVPTRLRPLAPRQSRAFACARLARVYEDLGQVEAAMNYYQATVAASPNAPWAQVTLADALRRRNDLAGAEAAYRQAIAISSEQDPGYIDEIANAYIRLAELLAARGDDTQAGNLYAEALQIASRQQNQQVERPEIESLSPPFSLPLFSDETLDGSAQPADGDGADASPGAPIFQQLRQAGEQVNAVRGLARLYLVQGQTRQAIELYQQRLEQGEAEGWSPAVLAQYYKSLGDLYLTQNQLDEAMAAYRKAVNLAGGWTEARLGLAEALVGKGDTAEALAQLQAAVAAAPGSAEAQIALANLLDQQGKGDQALAIYEAAALAYPGHVRVTLALARAWQDRDRWDQAEHLYQQTIALSPGTADAYVGLAELYISQNRYDEAELLLQQALTVDRQNANVYIRLGDLAQSLGDAEQALTWYRRAAALPLNPESPKDQSNNVTLIDSLIRHGDYATALATIETVLAHRSGDSELWLRQGQIQRALGRYSEAEETLLEARRLNPADSRADVALAGLYLARGEADAALIAYRQAIDLQPAEASYYLAASQVSAAQSDFDEALAMLHSGQSQAAEPATLYVAMAALYLQQAKPDLALQTLERGLANDGGNVQLRLALGSYYASRADFDEAEQQYNQILEQQPDSPATHAALGDLYRRRGDNAKALGYYEKAVALEPANPGYYLALGNSYQLGQRTEEASAAYFQALTAVPTLADAYATLAAHYQGQERWDEARVMYNRGLAIAPTSEILLAGYSAFLVGRGDAEQALVLLDEAVQRSPTAATLTARASLYRALGRVEEAEQDLRAAHEQAPGSITVLVALGDFYRAQGDRERARQFYENAVSLLPGVPTGYLRLGDLASEQGNQEEAQRYADAARAAEPGALLRPDSAP